MLKSNVGSKLFRSILINISINGFVSYAFLIIAIINLHQEEACSKLRVLSTQYVPCHTILEAFEPNVWSFIFITIGFVFIYFYSSVIKKWKASAE